MLSDIEAETPEQPREGSPFAIGVRSGAPKPDVSTLDALRRTLVAAESIAPHHPGGGREVKSGDGWKTKALSTTTISRIAPAIMSSALA